jgi:sugar lactone lactonase YvrE
MHYTYPLRQKVAFLLIVSLLNLLLIPVATGTGAALSAPVQGPSDFIRRISLKTNDLVYGSALGKLYASVPSSVGSGGNSITTIDPATGAVETSVFVGSDPNKLALSDDGHSLYVNLDGAFAIRRFDVSTQTPGMQFSVGQDSFFGRYSIRDLAVAPGNPNLVAIARNHPGLSPPEAGVAVFDNGVQRPNTGPGHSEGSDFLAFSASESKLYGTGFSSGLKTYTVDGSGITVASSSNLATGAPIKFHNNRIFSSSGQVIDPESNLLLGTFTGSNSVAFVPDSAAGRVYFVTQATFPNTGLTLKAFAIDTFLLVGSVNIPGVNGFPTSLVRWGANGLAFRTEDELVIIQTSLIPSAEPIPTPTPVVSPTPIPSPTPHAAFIRQIPLQANDLVSSSATEKLYASVPSSEGSTGNSIAEIDPDLGTVTSSVFVGSEPTHLAQANDGATLYTALQGAGAIRRFNILSHTAGAQFPIGLENFGGVLMASDIAVAPDNASLVAVARQKEGVSPSESGTAVYDDGIMRTKTQPGHINGSDFLAFSSTGSTLYGAGFSGLSTMTIDADGVTVTSTAPFSSGREIVFENNRIYSTFGQVINPSTGALVGTFSGSGGAQSFALDTANGRIFFLISDFGPTQIRAYDINTFLPLGLIDLPGVTGAGSLVRWGTNGLAFKTASRQVFLIQSPLVNSSVSIPAPTPTPSPTPSPSPPYIPTFVRRVDLRANNIVYSNATQAIYASVPSSVGANGNSITKITPDTGLVGPATFVGSEPNKLAISSEGETLYVHLDGANSMRRFDVVSQTSGLQIPTSSQPPVDMEVVPGSPQSIAVSNGGFGSVVIYDDAVQRPNTGNNFFGVGAIEFGSTASTLYSYSNSSLMKFMVDGSGVTLQDSIGNLITGSKGLEFSNGLLYSQFGRVADPEAKILKGTFQGTGFSSVMAIDGANNRAFYASSSGSNVVVNAYDTNTFVLVGSITLPGVNGEPVNLIRWGSNGLAFNTVPSFFSGTSAIYLLQTELVSNAAPIPTGVQFELGTQSAFEGSSTAFVKVNRTGDISGATSVTYATADGTATAGNDYTSVSGLLTFGPGELSKIINVPIINDNLFEAGDETFSLNLSAPTGGALLTGPTTVITLTDNDFRPFVSVASATLQLAEGDAGLNAFVFNASLSNPSVETVTVDFATANGTAVAGSDYVANTGTITFSPGTTTASATVQVTGDTVVEPNETFSLSLSKATNASFISGSQTTATIINDDATAQFTAQNQNVSENSGVVSVTVSRIGDTTKVATVNFQTTDNFGGDCSQSNGNASAKCDFGTAGGTLQFGIGQTSKTILVSVVDDGYVEGNETITLTLSNPSGMTLGSAASTTITIADDDLTATNPFNTNAFFVRQQYLDFLFREPDTGGFNDWLSVLNNCQPNQGGLGSDPNCDRVHVSSGFFRSTEFGERGYFAYRFYHGPLGRRPSFAEFVPDMRRLSGFLTPAEQEAARAAFVADFMQKPEFLSIYAGLTDAAHAAQFIAKLEEKAQVTLPATTTTLPGQPPQYGRQELIDKMASGEFTAAQTLRAFIEQKVVFDAFFFRAFVAMQYFGYLLRDPEDAGYNDWVDVLTNGRGPVPPGDFRHLIFGFVWSVEYRQRFGP